MVVNDKKSNISLNFFSSTTFVFIDEYIVFYKLQTE